MVKPFREHISLLEAREMILAMARELGHPKAGVLPTEDALGFVLVEDVLSNRNVPHYVASAVDGYAVVAAETSKATPATVVRLGKERFLWVNTGGPLPDWCDAVVMVEDTSLVEGTAELLLSRALPPGANVRPVGEDVMRGQILARQGEKVGPALIALLLSAGVGRIPVYLRPRCLFIPTGDEICSMKEWMENDRTGSGKVPESNSSLLRGIFREWGLDLEIHPILPDSADLIRKTLDRVGKVYDLVMIGAGTAKGKRDHTAEVIESEGEIRFRWIRMKPGRPAMLGKVKGALVLGIPGFPMSTAVAVWSLAYPAVLAMSGIPFEPTNESLIRGALGASQVLECETMLPHSSPPGVEEWLRVKTAEIDGRRISWPLSSGASTMWAMHEADGYALLSPETVECPKGTSLTVWFTRTVPWEKRALFQGSDDPAFSRIVTPVRQRGGDLAIRAVGSLGGLAALGRGEGHIAACHLLDGKTGKYNDTFINELSGEEQWNRYLLYYREQGFLVAKGNPKGFSEIGDLVRKKIRIVNRQPGAGTRVLLDWFLEEAGLERSNVAGYSGQAITHLDAASRVASGVVDAALGIRAAADAFGLDFVTMAWEPFELVVPEKHIAHPGVRAVMDAVNDPAWRMSVETMGGYRWPD